MEFILANNKFINICKSILYILLFLISINYKNKPIKVIKINSLSNNSLQIIQSDNLKFHFFGYNYYFSKKFYKSKMSFFIKVFDIDNNLILPSNLSLTYHKHIICYIHINKNINIYSLAYIENDSYFKCTEFYNLNEHIKIGVIIYETPKTKNKIVTNYTLFLIDKCLFKVKYNDNDIFNSTKIDYNYYFILSQFENNSSLIDNKKLKKLYYTKPINSLKREINDNKNKWNFLNIYNEFFCFCYGSDCLKFENSKCKYYFYLYLIDINHKIYNKEDFLLLDFIYKRYSSDDVFPVFKKLINRKLKAHYITQKRKIYKKYCKKKKYCHSIILVKNKKYKINGNFIEKYLTLILKLKQVISNAGVDINFINNIFFNINYITYICIGHGVSYFKYYLYQNIYGPQNFDKLLIPNSERLINMTKKYGWKEENLLKFNLPRWEKYNRFQSLNAKENIRTNSIFIMFTWRELKNDTNISFFYINNILNLINNDILINNLIKYNLTIYFALHHKLNKYKNIFALNSHIHYIEDNEISECLSKTNLIVTDYSSIVFDIIYRKKPYIIFIPDAQDPNIINNYSERCYKVIKNFTNNDFDFKNVYFDINSTINKINDYIKNSFCLDSELKKFYDDFHFNQNENLDDFINYILK